MSYNIKLSDYNISISITRVIISNNIYLIFRFIILIIFIFIYFRLFIRIPIEIPITIIIISPFIILAGVDIIGIVISN